MIKKTNKNTFSWNGKLDKTDDDEGVKYLKELQQDQNQLSNDESQLDRYYTKNKQKTSKYLLTISRAFFNFSAIKSMKMMNKSLESSRTFLYITKNDIVEGFGHDQTLLIAKDFKCIKISLDSGNDNSLLLNNHKQATVKNVHIIGDVVRPTQLKLVNSDSKRNSDSNLLFCLDEDMASDEDTFNKPSEKVYSKHKVSAIGRTLNINLFRRRLKVRKFLELEKSEREKLATSVLNFDRYNGKSIFHLVDDKQLVLPKDYDEPDFIALSEPNDTVYEQSYSREAPSVYDLFDIEIDDPVEEYSMMEYLDDE